jgi:hypothetical protein
MPTFLTPIGPDFQINKNRGGNNGISGGQLYPDIALLPDGRFAVTYSSPHLGLATDFDAIVATFNTNGTLSSASLNIFNASGHQQDSAVAARLDGGLAVVFENDQHADNTSDPNGSNITYRTISSSGSLGPALAILAIGDLNGGSGHDALRNPAIATLSTGRQVVVFERVWTDGVDHDLFLNVVNAAGTATQFAANNPANITTDITWQANPAVAAIGNKAIVVYEDGTGTTTASANIRARIFDGASNTLAATFTIADHTARLHTADVAAIDAHRYAIVYGDQNDVWARVYDTNTATLSAEIQLDGTGGPSFKPQVSGAPGAGFVVTWVEWTGVNYDIKARLFDGLANGVGSEFIVSSAADEAQFSPTVAASDHHIFFAWEDYGTRPEDGSPTGIRGRSFQVHDGDGNPLVDSLYYLERNPDVLQAGIDPTAHFNASGWREGRDPSGFFDVSAYLAANPDVRAAGINPLDHYHASGWREGRDPAPNFDTTYYLLRNPDVAAAGVDPLAHYLDFGLFEGRQIHQAIGPLVGGFDAQYYLFNNPDVAAAGVDPLAHFNAVGWREGRNPNAWFDTAGYLSHYADVAAAGVNPLQHYQLFGWKEVRDPSTIFDTSSYLSNNPDVAAANVNPLDHFLHFGAYEGRQAVNDGLWR